MALCDTVLKKILIIDDDPVYLSIVEVILEKEYEVAIAKSGKDALFLITHGFIPSLILLDILMPDMDGWETFNHLKAITLLTDTPIVFLTSLCGEAEEKRSHEVGAAGLLRKPAGGNELLECVDSILR